MIRHILKLIWNERRINAGIMVEFILVFCIFWFCCDFLVHIGKSYFEYQGYNIDHTYFIKMGKKDMKEIEYADNELIAYKSTFTERVKQYPGVEYICFSESAMPYAWGENEGGYLVNSDSTWMFARTRRVSPEFMDVFKMQLTKGRRFEANDVITGDKVIIGPNRKNRFGEYKDEDYFIEDVHFVNQHMNHPRPKQVIGVVEKMKSTFYQPFSSAVYSLLPEKNADIANQDIVIRVSGENEKDFAERFVSDMKEQLSIGPYFLISVSPMKNIRNVLIERYVSGSINSVLAITVFVLVNIFLGLIGTFWSRTQSRRSEIGLRIAMGSSKQQVHRMMFAEMFIMLFVASLISTYICLNVAQTDLLDSIGIPYGNREDTGLGNELDIINYVCTFLFIGLVSCMAIWYPASQSANIAPAAALRDE